MGWNPFDRRRGPLRFLSALGIGTRPPGANAGREATAFALEANDDDLAVRSASGGSQVEYTDGERLRAVRLSRRLYYRNGIYGQLVDLFVSWIVGDGVVIEHQDEKANAALQAVLEDPQNVFYDKLPDRVTRWFVDGEIPFTFLQPWREAPRKDAIGGPVEGIPSGVVYYGRADPLSIGDIKVDALDADCVRTIVLAPVDGDLMFAGFMQKELPVGRPGVKPVPLGDTQKPGLSAGAVQLWRLNPLGVRGAPLLSRIIDKADVLDRIVQGTADKIEATNERLYDASYDSTDNGGAADTALEAKLLAHLTGRNPRKISIHPKGVEIKADAPDLKLPDTAAAYEMALDWILGSVGVPRMWFASGGDTNRATAVEQGSPIQRVIRKKQAELSAYLQAFAAYTVYLLQLGGVLPESVDPEDIRVTMPEVATRDVLREIEGLSALANAMRDLEERKAVSPEEAQKILRRAVESLPMGEDLDEKGAPPLEDPAEGGAGGGTGPVGTGTDVQQTALNGAQIASVVDVCAQVGAGTLTADAAKAALRLSFPGYDLAAMDVAIDAAAVGATERKAAADAAEAEAAKARAAGGGGPPGGPPPKPNGDEPPPVKPTPPAA